MAAASASKAWWTPRGRSGSSCGRFRPAPAATSRRCWAPGPTLPTPTTCTSTWPSARVLSTASAWPGEARVYTTRTGHWERPVTLWETLPRRLRSTEPSHCVDPQTGIHHANRTAKIAARDFGEIEAGFAGLGSPRRHSLAEPERELRICASPNRAIKLSASRVTCCWPSLRSRHQETMAQFPLCRGSEKPSYRKSAQH